MADQLHTDILRRMAGQQKGDVADSPLTSSRAVRIALTKVAQDSVGLSLSVKTIDESVQSLDEMLADLPDDLMLVTLQRGGGLAGLMAVDMQLRAAVLEMQTVGAVSDKSADIRTATNTDKRMCDPLLNGLMTALPIAVLGTEFEGWMDGVTPAQMLQSTRSASLLLEDLQYRALRVTVALGAGEREGRIDLALPVLTRQLPPVDIPSPTIDWSSAFRAAVSDAPMALDAELCRFPISIGRAENLAVGDVLPLPGCTVASVRLRALDGKVIRQARLGQSGGKRAIRIEPEVLPEMDELTAMSASNSQAEPDVSLPTPDVAIEPAIDLVGDDIDMALADAEI